MSDTALVCADHSEITLEQCVAIGKTHSVAPPFILGIRYPMAGLYDDAICVVDTINFEAFNGNTSPSRHGRGMATVIAPQVVEYKIGIHNLHKAPEFQYQALCQAGPIRVTREGIGEVPAGFFGINIHRGGNTTPGSEGCQTLPPQQWPKFMAAIWATLKMRNIYTIKYLLVNA